MSEIAVSVSNVSKCYRVFDNQRSRLLHALWPAHTKGMQEVWALKDINFEIKRGEAVAIIGRNGGGKSTLLEILTGTLTPTTGSVTVNGRVSALLELGSGFNPEYSGRDNIILNGLLLGLSREDILSRFSEIEAFAEIGAAIDRPVKTYSSGMMMRLAFAVQVLCDPDILIIDEALSVGDFFFQQKCLSYIRGLCARGVTLLFVSHDMGTVRDLCSRVVYLKQGTLHFDGKSTDGIPLFFREYDTQAGGHTSEVPTRAIALETPSNSPLENIKANAVWMTETPVEDLVGGKLLAVAFYDVNDEPKTTFKIGETVKISVAYINHEKYQNHVTIGLTNKYGNLITATGSSQLSVNPIKMPTDSRVGYFDLWLTLLLEAGNYSVTITLGYETGVNFGERLDQSPQIGPIQVAWDYRKDKAPFIGQCGLPVRAAFRSEPS
jgi:lipopolysaccharide transport system ATP-binding protein